MHPEVLVAGMPNSGTSFATELVVRITGLSPGPARDIKKGDRHNPYGYWEYLPLRNYIWANIDGGGHNIEGCIPLVPEEPREGLALADIARAVNVQVFKCCTLPWTYQWFGEPRKTILIRRAAATLYERYYKLGKPPAKPAWEWGKYRAAHTRYYDLAAKYLDGVWDVLWVEYEDFLDTETAIRRVCHFLERPYRDDMLEIWRPRC